MHSLFKAYHTEMTLHMDEEKEVILPLLRAYYRPKEVMVIDRRVVFQPTTYDLGSFVYYEGKDRFRRDFMKSQGVPSIAWYLVFRRSYRAYAREVAQLMKALQTGQEPTQ